MEDEQLIYKLYYRFYMLCLKIGLITIRSHTERFEDEVHMILEPKWRWQR